MNRTDRWEQGGLVSQIMPDQASQHSVEAAMLDLKKEYAGSALHVYASDMERRVLPSVLPPTAPAAYKSMLETLISN